MSSSFQKKCSMHVKAQENCLLNYRKSQNKVTWPSMAEIQFYVYWILMTLSVTFCSLLLDFFPFSPSYSILTLCLIFTFTSPFIYASIYSLKIFIKTSWHIMPLYWLCWERCYCPQFVYDDVTLGSSWSSIIRKVVINGEYVSSTWHHSGCQKLAFTLLILCQACRSHFLSMFPEFTLPFCHPPVY